MIRPLFLLCLAFAPALAAQTAPAPEAPTTSAPATTTSYSLEERANTRLSSQLADSMPKYSPPKPPPPPSPEVDIRDVDKPRNTIKRLPKYMVRAPRPPVFREQDIYTNDGLGALGVKKYAGLNLSPILNQKVGEQMIRDDQRTANMADLEDTASDIGRGTKSDAAESEFIRKESTDTYLRQESWTPSAPNR